ncbi:hypothetical protein [Sulfitobacter pontiacus]|jgi:hypothetical protein|uniref:hypothetical protein n=1 Tax=Sulfitobacter pontiacus TaxID=60137 RepID=UPI000ECEC47C|nr:hypothetical protein [Sulfitobacter pontiacus]HCI98493.1 hypothetical protein [Sulfitobacter sp.]|tara:strand:+ start:68 stop:325 length:258 start_codon:yes stop_codon:yes gene_type:complete
MTIKTVDTYDTEGLFVTIVEGKNQAPMILETEGNFSSFDQAQERIKRGHWLRACVCRVVPVSGNELLALDMLRMQPLREQEEELF